MLDTAFTLNNGIQIQNRIIKSALEEELGLKGVPHAEIFQLYRRWSQGRPGLLITGNVVVDRRAPTGPRNIVLEDDRHLDNFKRWAHEGTLGGNKLIMQINHAGRQVPNVLVHTPVAPSAIGVQVPGGRGLFNKPKAMSVAEIQETIQRFRTTAALAMEAGFDGVQIHAAHGYLISQFLSPQTNQRQDEWGGSLENRARFLFQIIQGIRAVVPEDKILAIKLNSADFQRGGFSEEESLWLVQQLEQRGLDLLEVSGGNYESPAMIGLAKATTVAREAYFLDFADKVRQVSALPMMVTGGFRSRKGMEAALSGGTLDFIGMGKPFVLYPDIAQDLISGELEEAKWPMKKINNPAIESQSIMGWSRTQIQRLANGKEPNPRLGIYWNLLYDSYRTVTDSLRYKRWLKAS